MKKQFIVSIILCLAYTGSRAQQADSMVTVDQLQVPSSPALNLLGTGTDNIERPKNPTDFAVSLANATQNFSVIPKNYGVEIAPYWILGGKNTSFNDFIANKVGKNILQTATVSLATGSGFYGQDSTQYNQVAVAVKFSIFRGTVGKEFTQWNDSASRLLGLLDNTIIHLTDSLKTNDSVLISLKKSIVAATDPVKKEKILNDWKKRGNEIDSMSKIIGFARREKADSSITILNGLATRTDFKRVGWKLDAAFGTLMDYPGNNLNQCYVTKIAGWLTGGYDGGADKMSIMVVARITNQFYYKILNDSLASVNDFSIGSFDWGFHIFKDFTNKLTVSFEYVNRIPVFYNASLLKSNNIQEPKTTDRYVLTTNYKVGKNQNIGFTFGKDFDNLISTNTNGNLIAALNLGFGFGSSRPGLQTQK